jgi:hypothetical protein
MGLLFASDPDYGWEHWADLTWSEHGYELGKRYTTGGEQTIRSESIAGLPPFPPLLSGT